VSGFALTEPGNGRSRFIPFRRGNQTVFGISEENRAEFEQIVSEAFVEEISRGAHYAVTEQADERTILVRGAHDFWRMRAAPVAD
jgi:hypothetical protein